MKKSNAKVIIFYVALIAVIFIAVFAMIGQNNKKEEIHFGEIIKYFEQDRVKDFNVSNEDVITLVIYDVSLNEGEDKLLPEAVDSNTPTKEISYQLRDISIFIDAFENVKVLSKTEILLRKSVMIEKYLETVILEAKTIVEMFNKTIFDSLESFVYSLKQTDGRKDLIKTIVSAKEFLTKEVLKLSDLIEETKSSENISSLVRDKILPTMKLIRKDYDKIEPLIPDKFMPFPNYNKILY